MTARKRTAPLTSAKPGDDVSILCTDETISGTLMPSEDSGIVVIKLQSGYNIGIDAKRIKKITITQPYTSIESKTGKDIVPIKGLPTISVLHTGGTIASKVDYRTGGVVARFSPQELLDMFPEIGKLANLRSRFLSNMWSEDMRFAHYSIMARAVEEEIKKGCSGVIITHGTDTIHYTAAALSFILENLPVPVILLGAQRSSDRGSSDAAMNLICAVRFIVQTAYAGVALCMHATSEDTSCAILPATKTRKNHSSRRDAFQPVNAMPIALVQYEKGTVQTHAGNLCSPEQHKPFLIRDKMEDKVGLLKLHTNMHPDQFRIYQKLKYKGLILEGTGLGQAPTGTPNPQAKIHAKSKQALADLIKSGCIVGMTSQTISGRVHMHVYDKAIDLVNMGIIPCEDMTPETAFIKLAWLLGNYPPKEAKQLMANNLRGEISSRSVYDHFPIQTIRPAP